MRRALNFPAALMVGASFAVAAGGQVTAPPVDALPYGEWQPDVVPGSPAPALTEATWVHVPEGRAAPAPPDGKVWVIGFYATWARVSDGMMQDLERIAKERPEIGVAAVAVWEDTEPVTPPTGNGPTTFEERVRWHARERAYAFPVAYGGDDNALARRWLGGAGRTSVPTVFLIDRAGRIAWYGHPAFGFERALEQLLAGTIDIRAESQRVRTLEQRRREGLGMATALQSHIQGREWEKALELCDKILALDPAMFGSTAVVKMNILTTQLYRYGDALGFARQALGGPLATQPAVVHEVGELLLWSRPGEERDAASRELALEYARKYVEMAPDESGSYRLLAKALAANGLDREAGEAGERAAKMSRSLAEEVGEMMKKDPE
ncbi:MAG TPA: hypothetical protein VD971_00580 [Phycisphaerales bacterium]|nr:hypothetical protein [Phycisphaerales bacterium]